MVVDEAAVRVEWQFRAQDLCKASEHERALLHSQCGPAWVSLQSPIEWKLCLHQFQHFPQTKYEKSVDFSGTKTRSGFFKHIIMRDVNCKKSKVIGDDAWLEMCGSRVHMSPRVCDNTKTKA